MDRPVFVNNEVARILGPSLGKQGAFQSYAGVDISCYVYFPDITKSSLVNDTRKKSKLFAELQTLSISSTRSINPVRVLGRSSPLDYTRGARSFAGTMVFASINQDVFADLYDESIAESTIAGSSSLVSDQLPPFSIVITAANEKGAAAIQVIHGVTLVNYGTTYSIDDLYTEVTYTYVATDVLPLTSSSISVTRDKQGTISSAAQVKISDIVQKEMGRNYGTAEDKVRMAKERILKANQENGLYRS